MIVASIDKLGFKKTMEGIDRSNEKLTKIYNKEEDKEACKILKEVVFQIGTQIASQNNNKSTIKLKIEI